MRIAIIGGLAAGPAAAAELAREAPDAEVVLFEATPHVSVGACEMPYYVAGRLSGPGDLIVNTPEELARKKGITVHTEHRVTALDPRAGTLTVEATRYGVARTERFDRFVLATGARARRLGVPGEEGPGVLHMRHYADAVAARRWFVGGDVRHVVVVGGGYVGLEMAEAARDAGLRASILDPSGRVLSRSLHPDMGAQLDRAVRARGVAVRADTATEILRDADGRPRAVRTEAGELVGGQAVVVAVGTEPRAALAEAAGLRLTDGGAVWTDDEMRTSSRRVWACGDCTEVERVGDGRRMEWPLAPVGRRTARVAARNCAHGGGADRFRGFVGAVAVKAFGIEAASVGLDEGAAREAGLDPVAVQIRHTTRTAVYPGTQPIDVRLVVARADGRVLGGQLVAPEGAALRADVLVPMIRAGQTAQDLAEDMDLVYNPPVAPALDPLKVAAAAALRALSG